MCVGVYACDYVRRGVCVRLLVCESVFAIIAITIISKSETQGLLSPRRAESACDGG